MSINRGMDKENMTFARKLVQVEMTLVSELSQSQKDKITQNHVFSHMWFLDFTQIHGVLDVYVARK